MMLDSHPEIAIPYESQFLYGVVQLPPDSSPDQFADLIVSHFTWPDFHLHEDAFRAALSALPSFKIADGLRILFHMYAARFGKSRWGDKTPDYGQIIPYIEAMLPEAHFLHIHRDGRDVSVSIRPLWFAGARDMVSLAKSWRTRVTTARQLGQSAKHYLEVAYDQLVINPQQTLRRICKFIDAPYEPAMLTYFNRATHRLQELQDWQSEGVTADQLRTLHKNLAMPPRRDRIGRWKHDLDPEEVALFEAHAGDALRDFGYLLSS